jgi:hypothetical protein
MNTIHEDWEFIKNDTKITFPDGRVSNLLKEGKIFALDVVTVFFRTLVKNKAVELPIEIFPAYHEITEKICKMYYMVDKNEDF